jgi:diguanylate cyclase (GGDEF)-like protein
VTLRARLTAALLLVLVGPALHGAALLAGALPLRSGADETLDQASDALRRAVAVQCRHLEASAESISATAAVRREPLAVVPEGAAGPWALCGTSPGPVLLPAGTHYGGLAARVEIHDANGTLTGYAYAVQPLNAAFLRELSSTAGGTVTLLAVGEDDPHRLNVSLSPGPSPALSMKPVGAALPLALDLTPPPSESELPVALAIVLTAGLVAGLLSWWLSGVATRPLAALLGVVERVAAGDLTVRSMVAGRDETGRLGSQLDRLITGMQETQRLSVTDPLTGLGNVRHLGDSLRREVERASRFGRSLGVLVLDLDHFKDVNDSFGHRAGDAVLVEFAVRIKGVIREVDLAFRQGGEEFVILLPETDVPGSLTVAHRIGEAIRDVPFRVRRRRVEAGGSGGDASEVFIPVTVSIGVAVFPRHALTGAEVLDAADEALYAAKESGRDTHVLASASVPEQRVPIELVTPRAEAGGASGGTTSPRTSVGG